MVSRQASVCPYYRTCPWRGLDPMEGPGGEFLYALP